MRRRTFIGAFAGSAVLCRAPAVLAATPIKIGVIQCLSGAAAPFGIPQRDVAKMMVDRVNAEGGVNGRKLELAIHDDQTNPTEAARGATRLIRQEGVVAIVGSSTTGNTLALMPIAQAAKVPVLAGISAVTATASSNPFFPWIFRTSTSSHQNMVALLEKMAFAPGRKRIALFYQEDAFGKEEAEIAAALVKEKPGFTIVENTGAAPNAIDLTAPATRIRNANPDVVLMHTSAPAMGGNFVRAARQVGLQAPIGGAVSLGQQPFIDACGPAGEGVRIVTLGNWADPSPRQQALGEIMRAAGLKPAGYADLFGSTAIMALVEAAKGVDGDVTGQKLRDRLEGMCGFQTYMDGPLCYSKQSHDGLGPDALAFVEIKDGKFRTIR